MENIRVMQSSKLEWCIRFTDYLFACAVPYRTQLDMDSTERTATNWSHEMVS